MSWRYFSSIRFGRPLILICALALFLPLAAQENYMVGTTDGILSLYDFTTNSLQTTIKGTGVSSLLRGPNNRLAFAPKGIYLSVLDTTIQREIDRLTDVTGDVAATTPDGKLLIVPGEDGWLRIVDTTQLKVVHRVSLKPFVSIPFFGGMVVASNKAFIFPYYGQVVVVDLATYSTTSVALPDGQFDSADVFSVTPDGKTLVAIQYQYADFLEHVLLLSTFTNTLVADYPQNSIYGAYALQVTANGSDSSKIFGYLAGADINNSSIVVALDLRPNSPTYGQVLPSTTIRPTFTPNAVAVSSDGSRLVVAGSPLLPPANNTYVIDTAKMLTDPFQAVLAQLAVAGGASAYATCVGFFSITPPNTAPVVSGVSGNVTNDADHQIQITGGNFQQGALVRIGSMPPLATTFMGSSALTVTVPANAPAGKGIDVIVTNPETNAPQSQQNQSGLLANQFNIILNPKFQPTTQFGVINNDSSFSVYDLVQRQMVNVQQTPIGSITLWPDFNADGKQLYLSGDTQLFRTLERVVFPVDLSSNTVGSAIMLPGDHQFSSDNISASFDPNSGKPVVNALARVSTDLSIMVIDSNPDSPTFNTIIRTFDSGSLSAGLFPYGIVTTPDGKFSYIWYRSGSPSRYFLGIVNLSTGTFTQVTATSLGISQADPLNGIRPILTPDGKSLLLSSFYAGRWHIEILDISKPTTPKRIAELTPISVPGYGFPIVTNYQVVGNQLYAFDPRGVIVIFNFNRSTGDFRERGWYIYPAINTYLNSATQFAPNFAFSPDGAWLYVADPINDLIAVLDPTKLISGKDVIVTTIRAPYYPYRIAVSRVAPPNKLASVAHLDANGHAVDAPVTRH